ncbi:hypothetical protein [Methylacidimicrobium tartarophylax]|uniref:Uncharacterized protein n=1 Tax=Methylacidimicrobium tartarophylax TaxID=1041768 RepID=A0A5E6MPX3_9BACT|nr:hypothetical protein [Methylacidimicrobium tartarophylax]VVM08099.1 hypothetical protein MAMT_02103 [Methylacidimicrobium tartarophylax]
MKRVLILLFVVSSVLSREANADEPLFARWYPAEQISGPLGSGTGRLIYGMMQYGTFPNRRYVLLGYVRGLQNSYLGYFWASRQAVSLARQHGADAIIKIERHGPTQPLDHFALNGEVIKPYYPTVGAYAAIRFLDRKKDKPARRMGCAASPAALSAEWSICLPVSQAAEERL